MQVSSLCLIFDIASTVPTIIKIVFIISHFASSYDSLPQLSTGSDLSYKPKDSLTIQTYASSSVLGGAYAIETKSELR